MIFTDNEIALAMIRISRSADGKFLQQMLIQELQKVTSFGLETGAVLRSEGRRSLALELIRSLEYEPEKVHGRANTSIELAGRQPRPSRAIIPSRRRVPIDPSDANG